MKTIKIFNEVAKMNCDIAEWKVKDIVFTKQMLFKYPKTRNFIEWQLTAKSRKKIKLTITDDDFADFYTNEHFNFLIEFLTYFIDSDSLEFVEVNELDEIFTKFFILNIFDIEFMQNTQNVSFKKTIWEHKGQQYYVTTSEHIADIKGLIGKQPFKTYAETRDLLAQGNDERNGDFDYIVNIITILTRKKNEKYKEKIVKERFKIFLEAPYRVYLGVFFRLAKALTLQTNFIQISSLLLKVKELATSKKSQSLGTRKYSKSQKKESSLKV